MPKFLIRNIIQSEKAKTVEQAFSIIQHLRSINDRQEKLVLDFSGITWITSMFVDRLIKALASFYGDQFEQKLMVTGIEKTNIMFHSLWESAIEKFRYAHGAFEDA